jgi:hypothetical protein
VAEGKSIPGDVTFEVPVNLTRLAGDIRTVEVSCRISSDAIMLTRTINGTTIKEKLAARLELPVAAGQLVTTARVVVPVPTNAFTDPTYAVTSGPSGQTANYQCGLMGFSALPTTNGGGWSRFTADNPNESFRLSPTPLPITGSFVW